MPDITMCTSIDCPMRTWCYRYTATPAEWFQGYFTEAPYDNNNPTYCDYFWFNGGYDRYEIKELKNGN